MPSHKAQRNTEDIRRELTAIFRELKDPRVTACMLSIVRVDVTPDLYYCTVYVSAMEGLDAAKKAVEGLKSAAGYIRRELGRRLQLRHLPQMIFKPSDLIEYSVHMAQKISELHISHDDADSESEKEEEN